MFSVTVKETYQKNISSPVRVNFDVIRYLSNLEEVSDNIKSIEKELDSKMIIIQKRTRKMSKGIIREIEFTRPKGIGTLIQTITVTKYNPPKEVSLI